MGESNITFVATVSDYGGNHKPVPAKWGKFVIQQVHKNSKWERIKEFEGRPCREEDFANIIA